MWSDFDLDIKEILNRLGYIRNEAKLSARELSEMICMSSQYVAQLERGRIKLTINKLLQILEACKCPIERFFSSNIEEYNVNDELTSLIENLPIEKKNNIIEFLKK